MKKKHLIFVVILITFSVFAQDNPRVAVVPFNAVGVSENEALIITGLFETALVNTESFNVIEQNQIADIMEAQSYSIGGCTDESCAIEVGKLLSAEQIILGDLSSIGGKIILNAKIIDVEQGRNIKADKVDAAGMAEMTDAVELLAYKLAGLTITSGGDIQIAQSFGEVLIETNPAGADIFINGVKKGVSPDLLTRIPLGTITIEAKKGNLYAVENVNVSADTARLSLNLEEQFGNIFIKSSESQVEVILDGRNLGPLGSGFFDNLSIGNHALELKGQSVYWRGDVEVQVGNSTRIEAYPRGFGSISYNLPEGASAEISGNQYTRTISGTGNLNQVWIGKYGIKVRGGKYIEYEESVHVNKGALVNFAPNLVVSRSFLNDSFSARLTSLKDSIESRSPVSLTSIEELGILLEEIKISEYDFNQLQTDTEELHKKGYTELFLPKVAEIEEESQRTVGIITSAMADKADELKAEIENTPYTLPSLVMRIDQALLTINKKIELQDLYEDKLALEERIALNSQTRKGKTIGSIITLGIGAAGGILSGVFAVLGGGAYSEYMNATVTEDAIELKDKFEAMDLYTYISAGVAAAGLGTSTVLWLTRPDGNEYTTELGSTTTRITILEAELR